MRKMDIEKFITNFEQQNNTYLVYCPGSKEAIVVDPSFEIDPVIDRINELSLKVRFIINTHSHFDHIAGNDAVKRQLVPNWRYTASKPATFLILKKTFHRLYHLLLHLGQPTSF